jgi:hypothetical protein
VRNEKPSLIQRQRRLFRACSLLFADALGSARKLEAIVAQGLSAVDYDGSTIPIKRSKYEQNGYQPEFDKLPLEADYWAAQEKAKAAAAKPS